MKIKNLTVSSLSLYILLCMFSCQPSSVNTPKASEDNSVIDGKIATVSTSAELTTALNNDGLVEIRLKDGTYGDSYTVNKPIQISGSKQTTINDLIVETDGVKINSPIIGSLLAGKGIGDGELELKDVVITKDAVFEGGGSNSIKIFGKSKFEGKVVLDKEGLSFKMDAGTEIVNNLIITKPANLKANDVNNVPSIAGNVTLSYLSSLYKKTTDLNVKLNNLIIDEDVQVLSFGEKSDIDTVLTLGKTEAYITNNGVVKKANFPKAIKGYKDGIEEVNLSNSLTFDMKEIIVYSKLTVDLLEDIDPDAIVEDFVLAGRISVLEASFDVAWASSDASVISISQSSASVTRPENGNKKVVLTATVTIDGKAVKKLFTLTVLDKSDKNMPPKTPVDLKAEIVSSDVTSCSNIKLTWDKVSYADGYNVYVNKDEFEEPVEIELSSKGIFKAERGSSYEFSVSAYNDFGESVSAKTTVSTPWLLSFDTYEAEVVKSIEVLGSEPVGELPVLEKTYYDFFGWYTFDLVDNNQNDGGVMDWFTKFSKDDNLTSNETLFARYIEDAPAHHYRFEENFNNSAGSGLPDGVMYSSESPVEGWSYDSTIDGFKVGSSSLKLTQVGQTPNYLQIGSAEDGLGESFTIAFWMKPMPKIGDQTIISNYEYSETYNLNGFDLRLYSSDNSSARMDFHYNNGSQGSNSCPVQENIYYYEGKTWMHIAIVLDRNSNKIIFYKDGTEVNDYDSESGDFKTTGPFYIGARKNFQASFTNSYPGNLDDFRIYKKALSADEISSLSLKYD